MARKSIPKCISGYGSLRSVFTTSRARFRLWKSGSGNLEHGTFIHCSFLRRNAVCSVKEVEEVEVSLYGSSFLEIKNNKKYEHPIHHSHISSEAKHWSSEVEFRS